MGTIDEHEEENLRELVRLSLCMLPGWELSGSAGQLLGELVQGVIVVGERQVKFGAHGIEEHALAH